MGFLDNYAGVFKSHSLPYRGSSGRALYFGWWGPVWFVLYLINLPILGLVLAYISPLCCLGTLVISIVTAAIETIVLWGAYHLISRSWPVSGLQIAEELGRFEHTPEEGWTFRRYALSHKTALDMKGSSPHILVVGGSQTGKSATVKTLLLKLLDEKHANVILDYHGEYGFLADKGFLVVNVRNYNPLAPNYEAEPFEHIASDFVDSFLVAFESTGEVQLAILKKRLEEKRNLKAALATIGADSKATRSFTEKDRLTGLYLRLEKIVKSAAGTGTLKELVKGEHNVIFDFSGIRDRDAVDFYAENILRRYMALLVAERQPTNIIIDEAHRLNTKFLAERGFETTTVRIARESGKFGGRLIVASQNLTDFTPGFSANFGNILCFRSPAGSELKVLENITGIGLGQLQSVMNGMQKGEALLIGPHKHYGLVKIIPPQDFPHPKHAVEPEPEAPDLEVLPGAPVIPRVALKEKILQALEEGAATATIAGQRINYPKHAVWQFLQKLAEEGKVVRYEEVEIPHAGTEIYYALPAKGESSFHKVLIEKAQGELAKVGKVKALSWWGNPDLIFNERVAIEVETCTRDDLTGFVDQVKKRFTQGYGAVIVVTINKVQKKRYEETLAGIDNVAVVTFRELGKTAAKAKS